MQEQNLTPEEISEIKSIQSTQEKLLMSFGELELQIQLLELQKEKLIEPLPYFLDSLRAKSCSLSL